jgi:hypothetical protein
MNGANAEAPLMAISKAKRSKINIKGTIQNFFRVFRNRKNSFKKSMRPINY